MVRSRVFFQRPKSKLQGYPGVYNVSCALSGNLCGITVAVALRLLKIVGIIHGLGPAKAEGFWRTFDHELHQMERLFYSKITHYSASTFQSIFIAKSTIIKQRSKWSIFQVSYLAKSKPDRTISRQFLFARLILATQITVSFAQSLQNALRKPTVYSPDLDEPDSRKKRDVHTYCFSFSRFSRSYVPRILRGPSEADHPREKIVPFWIFIL